MRRTPLRKTNPERLKKLRAQQFGTDGKREWIISLPSAASGKLGWPGDPIDPAHCGRTRGAGAGPEEMAPLLRSEHIDYGSSMTDEKLKARHGKTRPELLERARELDVEWKARFV